MQNHSGNQVNETSNGVWSSSNPNVAMVNVGLVRPASAGALTASAGDDSYPFYATLCSSIPIGATCPFSTGVFSSSPGTVQLPGFLKVASPPITGFACTNASCAGHIRYQVLDNNGAAMAIAGMIAKEATTYQTTCPGPINFDDSSTWTTDATGTLTADDTIFFCASGNCRFTITQTFTVNGYPVRLMSIDKSITGTKNITTISITNGVSSCPNVVITP